MSSPGTIRDSMGQDGGRTAEEVTPSTAVHRVAQQPAWPDGHFYSPVVDVTEAQRDRGRVWHDGEDPPGIDFRPAAQAAFLRDCVGTYIGEYDYPEELPEGSPEGTFYTRNTQFSWLDARTLFAVLRHYRPRRMIEVGSGYSSLLTADVNVRFLGGTVDFHCIEPYPRPFLQRSVPGINEVIVRRVQDVDRSMFSTLREGDVLFIDSSHVSKTGSDVNYLYLDVLPRLAPGVLVHIHDIFLPREYPKPWVVEEGRSWNEQYLVQAFLMFNSAFEVVFGSNYAAIRLPERVAEVLGGRIFGGGSLWLQRRC